MLISISRCGLGRVELLRCCTPRRCWNWHTGQAQTLLPYGACGFESHPPHAGTENNDDNHQPTGPTESITNVANARLGTDGQSRNGTLGNGKPGNIVIAFTFPGQGSQKPGMGKAWTQNPSWELVENASTATGRDLGHLLLYADAEELKATRNAQVATFITALMALDAVRREGVEAQVVAGHSLGEYTALVAAGVMDIETGLFLVNERGEAMQEATQRHPGTMAAVLGMDDDAVESVCSDITDEVWVANYNAPGQVVIAGSTTGIESAATLLKERGAKKVLPIPVGGAFHTPFMAYARGRLSKAVTSVQLTDPTLGVYANVDAEAHGGAREWSKLLVTQLCSPVLWSQTLVNLASAGVTTFIEVGPGNVLTGMAKRTVKDAKTLSIAVPDDLEKLSEVETGIEAKVKNNDSAGEVRDGSSNVADDGTSAIDAKNRTDQ